MKTVTSASSILTFLAAIVLVAQSAHAQSGTSFRTSFQPLTEHLTVNEPVWLRFDVENGLDDAVVLDLGLNSYSDFRVRVIRPNGSTDAVPKLTNGNLGISGIVSIPAHEVFHHQLLMNRWFNFDITGRYILDVELISPARSRDGTKLLYPIEGHIVLDVGPRDAGHLDRVCAQLQSEIRRATSAAELAAPAEVLSYISDPVAVPYLADLLRSKKMLAVHAIQGLARIANLPAVDVLIAHIKDPSSDTSDLARGALAGIESTTQDLEIKGKIKSTRQ